MKPRDPDPPWYRFMAGVWVTAGVLAWLYLLYLLLIL